MNTLTLPDTDAQAVRARRACEEEFSFAPHPAGGHWCFSHASGKSYRVTESGCSCRDHEARCAGTTLRCKHRLALMNTSPDSLPKGTAQDAEDVKLLAKVAAKGREQRAEDARRFAELFS